MTASLHSVYYVILPVAYVMVVQNKGQFLTPKRTSLKSNVNPPKGMCAEAPFLSLFGIVFLNNLMYIQMSIYVHTRRLH